MKLDAARLLRAVEIKDDHYSGAVTNKWSNPDILPLPPSRRRWGYSDYLFFLSISNLCISTWTTASSLLSLGLSVGETLGVIVVSNAAIAGLMLANGWIGGRWHIGYTVSQRITLGMVGAYIGIVIRIVLSVVWYASQAWLGGLAITCILASWSRSFLTMHNTLPQSAHMVTRDLTGFTIFQVISLPLLFIRPERIRGPMIVSNVASFFVMLGITIWACSKGGTGPLMHQGTTTHPDGMSHGWAWVYGITSTIGSLCAGILNQADFTRFVRSQGIQVPGSIFSPLIPGIIVPVFGLLTASASVTIYGGDPIWNPLDLVIKWLTVDFSATSRAAAFFCGLGFAISQFSQNIASNGYSAGMDLSGLFPKWINIRRGSIICALLSWVVQPWLFYNTSSVFMATMSSFSVFLAPLTGIMICDYYLLRRGRIELSNLYTPSKEGAYWYSSGFNWRAVITWIIGFVPAMPGMIATLNGHVTVSLGGMQYYWGNYIFGFFESVILYYVLMKIFPPPRVGLVDEIDVYGTFTEPASKVDGQDADTEASGNSNGNGDADNDGYDGKNPKVTASV